MVTTGVTLTFNVTGLVVVQPEALVSMAVYMGLPLAVGVTTILAFADDGVPAPAGRPAVAAGTAVHE